MRMDLTRETVTGRFRQLSLGAPPTQASLVVARNGSAQPAIRVRQLPRRRTRLGSPRCCRSTSWWGEAVLQGPGHGLCALVDADLAVGTPNVGLHRVDAQETLVGDLLVAPALRDEAHHVGLAAGETNVLARK